MNISMLFPGQGSQSLGMLSEVYAEHAVIQDCFNEASGALGQDLWLLAQTGTAEELNKTENTQPLILTSSIALYRAWQSLGGRVPSCVAGHSLGEYSALVAANVLSFCDAVKLVRLRGELMQGAVPLGQGAMAAIIGLDDKLVVSACESAAESDVVSAVNFNAPGQVVIAGDRGAVERAIIACKDAGARRALPLPVSVPSHCSLMLGAANTLRDALSDIEFNDAVIPIIQNVNATAETEKEKIIDNLLKQLYSPVLWTQSVNSIGERGVEAVVECGPGKVLTGLVKRINKELIGFNIEKSEGLNAAIAGTSK